jgi:hypothetical protein
MQHVNSTISEELGQQAAWPATITSCCCMQQSSEDTAKRQAAFEAKRLQCSFIACSCGCATTDEGSR